MSGSSITLPDPPAPAITSTGITAPTYADYINYLVACFQAIYGADVYLGNDSMDYQLLSVFATSMADQAAAAIAVYGAFSPSTAQGTGLSTNVRINGLTRATASYSTAPLLIVGTAELELSNCAASDGTYTWTVPNGTVIPSSGEITVTGTCTTIGAINAAIGAIDTIATPTAGWQSVTNNAIATPGNPVEDDPTLRTRQSQSTMNAAQTLAESLVGQILALPGVVSCVPYENDTTVTNSLGIPPNSIALVIDGGSAVDIASVIYNSKSTGGPTYGTTNQVVVDSYGIPHTISWYYVEFIPIAVNITITPLTSYTSVIGNNIVASVVAYINSLLIGQNVMVPRVGVPAQLQGAYAVINAASDPDTFELVSIELATVSGNFAVADIPIAFYEQASCTLANVTLTPT